MVKDKKTSCNDQYDYSGRIMPTGSVYQYEDTTYIPHNNVGASYTKGTTNASVQVEQRIESKTESPLGSDDVGDVPRLIRMRIKLIDD